MTTLALSRQAKIYVLAVAITGFGLLGWAVVDLVFHSVPPQWLVLGALTFLSGSCAIRIPSIRTTVSVSEGLVFASALLFGPAAATVTVVLDGLIVSLRAHHRNVYRMLFAVGEPAVSVWLSVQLYYAMPGVTPLFREAAEIEQLMGPLILLITSYFLLNSWLTATAVWLETGLSPARFLRDQASHLSINYLASLCLVVLLVQNAAEFRLTAIGVLLLLLVIAYVSSKNGMARIEEANTHLAELNKLYLSTVETLATAIDAKDQITHGHIRRVQEQAVALARALGIRDEREIKAIEVAALLHDLGKLGVPEHILNKPAALTPIEFERMKTHASLGADILSHIEFPFSVGPIIRHHHENWDGTGYPDGLKGEQIPLAARILAVVDCFDALTSDRPYRRRLSPQQAMAILRLREGMMYDPRVVDTFLRLKVTGQGRGLDAPRDECRAEVVPLLPAAPTPAVWVADGRARALVVGSTAGESSAPAWLERITETLAHRLHRVVPEAFCVLYRYDAGAARLIASYVSRADYRRLLLGVTIPVGKRLTGWVAANLRTVANSDAWLDVGDLVEAYPTRLETCLSTPILCGGVLVGVLTLYSPNPSGFTQGQCRAVESFVADGATLASDAAPAAPRLAVVNTAGRRSAGAVGG